MVVDGVGKGAGLSGLSVDLEIDTLHGNPNTTIPASGQVGIITTLGSEILVDKDTGDLYMGETAGGSTWIRLVSGT